MAAIRLLPIFAALLFALGLYFVATDNAALGAAMFAIGASQFAIFGALKAAAAKKAQQPGDRP